MNVQMAKGWWGINYQNKARLLTSKAVLTLNSFLSFRACFEQLSVLIICPFSPQYIIFYQKQSVWRSLVIKFHCCQKQTSFILKMTFVSGFGFAKGVFMTFSILGPNVVSRKRALVFKFLCVCKMTFRNWLWHHPRSLKLFRGLY